MQSDKNPSKTNFTFFFKMLKIDSLPLEAQNIHIYKQIDHLLETENKEGVDIFISTGVKFTKKQVDTIFFKEDNALIYKLDAKHASIFTENNKAFIKELLVEKVKDYADFSKSKLLAKKYYITIPEKYRKTLDGKGNPESLLEDSLKGIKNSLTGLMEQLQEVNIYAMKKSNTYLKSITRF